MANAFDENTSAREPSKSISTLFEVGGADIEVTVGGAVTPSVDAYAGGPAGKVKKHNGHTQNYIEIYHIDMRIQSYTLQLSLETFTEVVIE